MHYCYFSLGFGFFFGFGLMVCFESAQEKVVFYGLDGWMDDCTRFDLRVGYGWLYDISGIHDL